MATTTNIEAEGTNAVPKPSDYLFGSEKRPANIIPQGNFTDQGFCMSLPPATDTEAEKTNAVPKPRPITSARIAALKVVIALPSIRQTGYDCPAILSIFMIRAACKTIAMTTVAMSTKLLNPSRSLVVAVGLTAYASVLARGGEVLIDPDVYMHIVVGRWILDHGALPHADMFSHSMHGMSWVPHEWLAEVVFAWLYDHFGWTSQVVVTALAVGLAVALLARALIYYLTPVYAVIGAMLAWGMCFPHLLARPHVFVYPLVVLWAAGLVAARQENRAPSPLLLIVLVLWANVHGSFLFGIVLAALFAAEALLEAADWPAARRVVYGWGLFGLLSLVAAFATPNGLAGFLLPIKTVRMSFAMSWISEWQSPNFQQFQPLELWLMLVLVGALLLGVRLPITRIAIMLVLLHMTLQHLRHGEYLGFITPLLFAPALALQLPRSLEDLGMPALRVKLPSGATFALGALALAMVATGARMGMMRTIDRVTPSAALAAAREHQVAGPVFNDFNFGGFLIFSGVPTMIDGRTDLYGDAFNRRYSRIEELPRLLGEYRIGWTLLRAGTPGAVLMDHLPGWQRLYADDIAVLHARKGAADR